MCLRFLPLRHRRSRFLRVASRGILSKILARDCDELLEYGRLVSTIDLREAQLPIDFSAFDPPAHKLSFLHFFSHRLQRHDADSHVFFDHASNRSLAAKLHRYFESDAGLSKKLIDQSPRITATLAEN